MYSAMFSDAGVTERTAYEISLEHGLMRPGLRASVFEDYILVHSIVLYDYSYIDCSRSPNLEETQEERTRVYL